MKEHEQNKFICHNCGWIPSSGMSAEELDHCPNCLSGIHKEDEDGYECGGIFEAVGIWVKAENEWNIIQRCSFCGEMRLAPMAVIIPGLFEPPVRTLRATIPENESHILR